MSSLNEQSNKVIEVRSLDEVEFRDFFRFLYLNRKGALVGAFFAIFLTLGWFFTHLPTKTFRINLVVSSDSGPAVKDSAVVINWLNQAFFDQDTRRNLAINLGLDASSFDNRNFHFDLVENRLFELRITPNPESLDSKEFVTALNKAIAQKFDQGTAERLTNFQRSLERIFQASIGLDEYYRKGETELDGEKNQDLLKLFEIKNELDRIEAHKSSDFEVVENSMILIEQLKLRVASMVSRKRLSETHYKDIRSRLDLIELGIRKNYIKNLPRPYIHTHISEILSHLEATIRSDFDPRKTAMPTLVVPAGSKATVFTAFNGRGFVIFAMASTLFLSICGLLFSGIVKFFKRNKNYITKDID
jgi:hypothetical protein